MSLQENTIYPLTALVNLHTELKLSLVRPRSNSESQELASKWEELSTYDQGIYLKILRFFFKLLFYFNLF